jgi:mannose-1-phosphate guanylyltransferase
MQDTYAVILAGGKGERFWPLSRKDHPKQLLSIGTDLSGKDLQMGKTMIEESVRRIKPLISPEKIFIVTNKNLKGKIEKLLPEIPEQNVVGEPVGKNTAPAIGLGTVIIQSKNEEAVIVVLTADHIIKGEEKFLKVLKKAIKIAGGGKHIITIGINPSYPATGYGHIKPDNETSDEEDIELLKVDKFIEKPDIGKAKEYTEKGYLWNAGIFVFRASTMIDAISEYMPTLCGGLIKIKESLHTGKEEQTIKEVYESLESESIDYGVMEKARNVYVIRGDFKWNDVGSWAALEDVYSKDEQGNVKIGNTVEVDTKHSILIGGKRLIATVGIEDIVIVETEDAVLVCRKNEAQKVKDLVREIEKKHFEN